MISTTKLVNNNCVVSFLLGSFLFVFIVSGQEMEFYNKAERTAIDKLRPLIAEYLVPDFMKTDYYHLRLLKAAKFDLTKVVENVKKTTEWRKDNNVDNILSVDLRPHLRHLPYKVEGFDKEGSPIIQIYFGKWELRKYALAGKRDITVKNLIQALEKSEHSIYENQKSTGQNIHSVYIVEDIDGFSLSNTACIQCLSMSAEFIRMVATHYPNIIKKGVIINAPRIFAPVTALIKQLFPPEVSKLISIHGHDKDEWQPIILKDISADQLPMKIGGSRN